MRKGEKTKEHIVSQAAKLFNRQGFYGSSITDIMRETGLRKGGIYNHFANKDELALQAFDYAIELMRERYLQAIAGKTSACEQLISLFSVYNEIVENPPLEGGCPLLNTAIDTDDTHPALKEKARTAMDRWRGLLGSIIRSGIDTGEFRADADSESVIIFLTAAFEGGVMISKLYDNSEYMRVTVRQMAQYITTELLVTSERTL
ncbi:TetR/AcrR family transcriptional regulator [Paenibacillus thiaminolyticus]|uniref:TetR/AcrR family transcriptional regulator n=1 Tax=Paenibacillus thiaminolyticus TaxID=49283 RepID=UPI003D2B9888